MTDRIVRDVCIEFARNTTSKVDRAVLLTLAFFAERDASFEWVALAPDTDDATMEKYMGRVHRRHPTHAPIVPTAAKKTGPVN